MSSSAAVNAFNMTPPSFQRRVYVSAAFVTMNTNSRSLRLSRSQYDAAIKTGLETTVMFPTVFRYPKPSDPNYVRGDHFVQPASIAEYNQWQRVFQLSIDVWGTPEVGPMLRLHHMHAVLVIRHHNFMRINRNEFRTAIEAASNNQIKYTEIKFIKHIDVLVALFYANKNAFVNQVVMTRAGNRLAVIAELKRWKQLHDITSGRGRRLNASDNNNNNNNTSSNNNAVDDNDDEDAYDGQAQDEIRETRRRRRQEDLSMWAGSRSVSAPAPLGRTRQQSAHAAASTRRVTRSGGRTHTSRGRGGPRKKRGG